MKSTLFRGLTLRVDVVGELSKHKVEISNGFLTVSEFGNEIKGLERTLTLTGPSYLSTLWMGLPDPRLNCSLFVDFCQNEKGIIEWIFIFKYLKFGVSKVGLLSS